MIISGTRCGSTTLDRALSLIPGVWVANQPRFDDAITRARAKSDERCEEALFDRVELILTDHCGIKHVFDPTGYPFQEPWDFPAIGEMERDAPLWHRLNLALLNYRGVRVVFLRRRDSFHRYVSDHVGQETGHWGFVELGVSATESLRYKKVVSNVSLPPLNEELTLWYTANVPLIFERLRSALANPVLDVWYEDIFGAGVELKDRIERFREIVAFLQIPAPAAFFDSEELALLLRPSAKLNDTSTFERIPNYLDLRRKLGIADPAPARSGKHSQPPAGSQPKERPKDAAAKAPFADRTIGQRDWRFRSGPGNLAGLVFPSDSPNSVRIEIPEAHSSDVFDIQLSVPDFRLEWDHLYELQLRARADEPRSIYAGVSRSHGPWTSLGLYQELELTPEWRDFDIEFPANGDDPEARLHFDLGGRAIAVEFASVRLRKIGKRDSGARDAVSNLEQARRQISALEEDAVHAVQREAVQQQELSAVQQRCAALEGEWEAGLRKQAALTRALGALEQELDKAREQVETLSRRPPAKRPLWSRLLGLRRASPPVAGESPDPPGGAFREQVSANGMWELRVAEHAMAQLYGAAGYSDAFQVSVKRAANAARWSVQLNRSGIRMNSSRRYAIHFRARSDRPRLIGAGISRNHEPWTSLGYYREFWLDPEWRAFRGEFAPEHVDDHARFHLDLGSRLGEVEIWGFGLQEIESSPLLHPAAASDGAHHPVKSR